MAFTHFLGKIGVVHRIEPGTVLAVTGKKEVPQAPLSGSGLYLLENFCLSRRKFPRAALSDLGKKFVLNGYDVVGNVIPHLLEERGHAIRYT
jgi:hypothetical protein